MAFDITINSDNERNPHLTSTTARRQPSAGPKTTGNGNKGSRAISSNSAWYTRERSVSRLPTLFRCRQVGILAKRQLQRLLANGTLTLFEIAHRQVKLAPWSRFFRHGLLQIGDSRTINHFLVVNPAKRIVHHSIVGSDFRCVLSVL